MDGKLFLGTAKFLINNGLDEAAFRSAVSRAYYACFLEARKTAFAYCDKNVRFKDGIKNEKDVRHEPLAEYFKVSDDQSIRQLGEDLSGLRRSRQKADYVMESSIQIDDAKDVVDQAELFLEEIADKDPTDIGKAMENYLSRIYGLS